MTAVMLIPSLLLQKKHAKTKSTEHSKSSRHRLSSWKEDDIEKLLNEWRAILSRLRQSRHPRSGVSCATLVEDGNLKAALRLLFNSITEITAVLMAEVCWKATVEPRLQPTTGEEFTYIDQPTQLECSTRCEGRTLLGERSQDAFFDVRVFNLLRQVTSHPSGSLMGNTRERNAEYMRSVSYRSNMDPSPHLSSQPVVAWDQQHRLFTTSSQAN